eukprot:g442.t1
MSPCCKLNTTVSLIVLLVLGPGACSVIDVDVLRAGDADAVPFLGIGAISGGGATSRLLRSYPAKQRGEILDYLFKPQYGASLSILKVEVGGDAQSTDGTEPSHRHAADEAPDFTRGYEWWLMKEAKKRNPDIRLWALPWAFPGWLDPTGGNNPYAAPNATARYVGEWVRGARAQHNLTIDFVGCWNERAYDRRYLRALRADLDGSSLSRGTRIIAPDSSQGVEQLARDMLADNDTLAAVDALGTHYPGGAASAPALLAVRARGRPLVASEDYGVYFAPSGAKALARLLNRNAVVGRRSGTVAWNLVSSYYQPYQTAYYGPAGALPGPAPLTSLPYRLCGLMHAAWPWAGHYAPTAQLWAIAHTTQFAQPGWRYLPQGAGSGLLRGGGSVAVLASPAGDALTVVIEKMSWPGSQTAWQGDSAFNVSAENVTLRGLAAPGARLAMWTSALPAAAAAAGADPAYMRRVFVRRPAPVVVGADGALRVAVCVDCLITLTTQLGAGAKGAHAGAIPPPAPFPLPYADAFGNATALGQEPRYLADQAGSFEMVRSAGARRAAHGARALRQSVPQRPISWADDAVPLTVIGSSNWTDTASAVDVMLEQPGEVWLGARLRCGPDPRPPAPNAPVFGVGEGEGVGGGGGGGGGGAQGVLQDVDGGDGTGARAPRAPPAMPLMLTNSTGVFARLSLPRVRGGGGGGGGAGAGGRWALSLYPRGAPIASGALPVPAGGGAPAAVGAWHRLRLLVRGARASGWLDGTPLFENVSVGEDVARARGFAAFGTGGFYHAQYGNFEVDAA